MGIAFYGPLSLNGPQNVGFTRTGDLQPRYSNEKPPISNGTYTRLVKCQAGQEGRVVDDGTDAPFLVEIDVVLIYLGLLGAVEDGENMWFV